MTQIVIEADIAEALGMLTRITGALNPEGKFARVIPERLDLKMHEQQAEKFASQGDGDWAPLSDMRTRIRGNSGPILDATGSFRSAVSEYVGMWSATPRTFAYIYPSMFMGDSAGRYFGLTAGQRKNPLAKGGKSPAPLKNTPRPILFGEARMLVDVESVFAEFLVQAGFLGDV